MWCRRRRSSRQRRPSRSNGSCIRRRRTWRSRTGQKFPISFLPRPKCFPPPHCRIWTGVTDSRWRWPSRLDAARRHLRSVPLPREAPWPRQSSLALASAHHRPARAGAEHFRDPGKAERDRAVAASVVTSRRASGPTARNAAASQSGSQSTPRRSGASRISEPPEARRVQICRPRQPQRSRCPSGPAETCGAGQEAKKRVTPRGISVPIGLERRLHFFRSSLSLQDASVGHDL